MLSLSLSCSLEMSVISVSLLSRSRRVPSALRTYSVCERGVTGGCALRWGVAQGGPLCRGRPEERAEEAPLSASLSKPGPKQTPLSFAACSQEGRLPVVMRWVGG